MGEGFVQRARCCLVVRLGFRVGVARVCAVAFVAMAAASISHAGVSNLAGPRAAQLLAQVEQRAMNTTFADLERFAVRAEQSGNLLGLRQLNHVVSIYLNQSEHEQALVWNERMAALADKLGNDRYKSVAKLNDLIITYDSGDSSVGYRINEVLQASDDWYVRTTATRYFAIVQFDERRIGEGLRLLSLAQTQIPENDPESAIAQGGVWEMIGVGLMQLNDVEGATDAFTRYELDHGNKAWPRPDFDSIYNLGNMAIQVGDAESAERFYAAHNRLTLKTNLSGLNAFNALMCARVATLKDDMPRVLRCLEDHDRDLAGDTYLQMWAWPLEASALARLGRVSEAERVMGRWHAFGKVERGTMISNLALKAQAELYHAKGQHADALKLMREYSLLHTTAEARSYSEAINQITRDMQEQLTQRRHQLEVEQANVKLQSSMLRIQTWIGAVILFFLICGVVAIFRLWRQARELREARSKAERASNAKTMFLANMSHEIRTPLNGVIAMADVLHRNNLSAKDHELVEIIRTSAGTLEHLLSDILDSARIESGELKLEAAPFNPRTMLEGVQQLWKVRAADKGVELKLIHGDDIDRMVMGDVVRLRQVMTNLVSNALKFTDKGMVTIEAISTGEDRVLFRVTDTGVGFDEQVRKRLFARFQQADESITRRYGGSGLGLNISRSLIALMDGEMDCTSSPGEGSQFWFEISLPKVWAPTPETTGERRDVVSEYSISTSKGLGLRVLLADDHAANRKVVEVLLGPLDVELTSVVDGAQAVEAFEADYFDLVLMDMQMPVMDGLTATRRLREIERRDGRVHTPIVMLTANAMSEHVEASLAAGADRHLTKPLTVQSLMNCITSALEVAA